MAPDWSAFRRASDPHRLVATITRGGWGKADLLLVEWQGARAVVKDFSERSWPVRLAGWLQISRELRAYRRLAGVEGIPRVLGRPGRCAFAMEEVSGKVLARCRLRDIGERRDLLRQLRRLLDAAHAAGVAHNDLRGHDNVLVSEDGRVHLVDFAGAICLRPGGLAHRLLFRGLARVDEGAFLKWKRIMVPEDLTEAESARLRRYERLRWLWVFNPKAWTRKEPLAPAGEAGPERSRGR